MVLCSDDISFIHLGSYPSTIAGISKSTTKELIKVLTPKKESKTLACNVLYISVTNRAQSQYMKFHS